VKASAALSPARSKLNRCGAGAGHRPNSNRTSPRTAVASLEVTVTVNDLVRDPPDGQTSIEGWSRTSTGGTTRRACRTSPNA
jgi:hypothetical protein